MFGEFFKILPRDDPRPRPPPSGLGIPPLPMRLLGLFLLPGNRFGVGDVGDLTMSVIFGRADRLRGCVPSSYESKEEYKRRQIWTLFPFWRSYGIPWITVLLSFWLIIRSWPTASSRFLLFLSDSPASTPLRFSPLRSSSQSSSAFVRTN